MICIHFAPMKHFMFQGANHLPAAHGEFHQGGVLQASIRIGVLAENWTLLIALSAYSLRQRQLG
jgi:hypothetical protein